MAVIRKLEISNFRSLKQFDWLPSPGINCIIGPGDSGKSTVLDAIDYCLGVRRNLQISDSDFHDLDVETPIQIDLTLGNLSEALKTLDSYGNYIRSFDEASGSIADEPGAGLETVLTLRFSVEGDLEPKWMLVSERTATVGTTRSLNWADRLKLAPTRLGAFNTQHLSWRRGSLLNRLSEERADASAALVKAGREARAAFGEQAKSQLESTLKSVWDTANYMGITVGQEVKALLDANSVSFSA